MHEITVINAARIHSEHVSVTFHSICTLIDTYHVPFPTAEICLFIGVKPIISLITHIYQCSEASMQHYDSKRTHTSSKCVTYCCTFSNTMPLIISLITPLKRINFLSINGSQAQLRRATFHQ